MIEEFRKIPNTNFSVSNIGRVRNDKTNKFRKYSISTSGYPHHFLNNKGFHLHILVCTAFNGVKPSNDHVCRHLDGNKLNPIATNLAWGTRAENEADKKLHNITTKDNKLTQHQIEYAKTEMSKRTRGTQARLMKELNVSEFTIRRIRNALVWEEILENGL